MFVVPKKTLVQEMKGDMDAHVLVTTPGEWGILICGVLIIDDEVHPLAIERGAVIKNLIIRLYWWPESSQRKVRSPSSPLDSSLVFREADAVVNGDVFAASESVVIKGTGTC